MKARTQKLRPAFTLVELLTVISVLVMLAVILVPSLTKYRVIVKARLTQSTISQLDNACCLYRDDFGFFPPSRSQDADPIGSPGHFGGWQGSQLLALFLTGYAGADPANPGIPSQYLDQNDGVNGPGFRIVPQGKVYGPYAMADKFAIGSPQGGGPRYFTDAFGGPIIYYRAIDPNNPIPTPNPCFNSNDNASAGPTPGPTDINAYARGYRPVGNPCLRSDFLLMSTGSEAVGPDAYKNDPNFTNVTNISNTP